MKFKNKKGKELKTILPSDVMNQMADIIEIELNNKKILYSRDGTKFNVLKSDVNQLLNAQMKANKELISKGIITMDMIIQDVKSNF